MVQILLWTQLIEDHEDDSVTRDHAQLNSDKMEAESVSGSGSSVAVENGVEDGTSTQSKSSQTTSVSLLSVSPFQYILLRYSVCIQMSCKPPFIKNPLLL